MLGDVGEVTGDECCNQARTQLRLFVLYLGAAARSPGSRGR